MCERSGPPFRRNLGLMVPTPDWLPPSRAATDRHGRSITSHPTSFRELSAANPRVARGPVLGPGHGPAFESSKKEGSKLAGGGN